MDPDRAGAWTRRPAGSERRAGRPAGLGRRGRGQLAAPGGALASLRARAICPPRGARRAGHHSGVEAGPLRVVIAEDSALIREGIARLIEESGGTVVAKVGDGPALVEAVEAHRPDVSVVDVR